QRPAEPVRSRPYDEPRSKPIPKWPRSPWTAQGLGRRTRAAAHEPLGRHSTILLTTRGPPHARPLARLSWLRPQADRTSDEARPPRPRAYLPAIPGRRRGDLGTLDTQTLYCKHNKHDDYDDGPYCSPRDSSRTRPHSRATR